MLVTEKSNSCHYHIVCAVCQAIYISFLCSLCVCIWCVFIQYVHVFVDSSHKHSLLAWLRAIYSNRVVCYVNESLNPIECLF